MDDRQLTLIVVPHGDLETRSFVISYRRLRYTLIALGLAVLLIIVLIGTWFPVALLAARVPALQRELATLESERAKVAELARTLSEVEAQYQKVRELLGADAPAAGAPPLLPPLRDSTQKDVGSTSQLNEISEWPLPVRGFVTQTVGSGASSHPGIDIAVPRNTEIRAAGAGTVVTAGDDEVYGHYIVLDHGGGMTTVYGHANKLLVKRGEVVGRGQKIALSGSSGRSTGSHLHFEVRRNNQVVDPFQYVHQPG